MLNSHLSCDLCLGPGSRANGWDKGSNRQHRRALVLADHDILTHLNHAPAGDGHADVRDSGCSGTVPEVSPESTAYIATLTCDMTDHVLCLKCLLSYCISPC